MIDWHRLFGLALMDLFAVLNEVAEAEHNVLWHLFSAVAERVDWGAHH